MKKQVFYWLVLAVLVVVGCQKETSFELGNTPAQGSLQSDVSGDCFPKSVNGIFEEGLALVPAANTITISVNVTRTGIYEITTDTVNGYYFRGVGTFTTLGPTVVTLRGNGTPFVTGTDNFVVSYDGSICDIAVDVLPAGASSPAVFTLVGAPGNCTGAVVSGTYSTAAALTATGNTVTINVNVSTIGTYNVTTTFQGMTFKKTGVFITPGANTITLEGSGTPTTAGANIVPFTVGTTTCNFTVNVLAPVTGTLGGGPGACTPAVVNGTYGQGIATTAANTVDIQITTSTVGSYSVSTNTVAGFSFSGFGTTTGAAQTITLTANGGAPSATGPQTFTVTFGTSTCTFVVNVQGPAVFTKNCAGAIVNGTYTKDIPLTAANTITLPVTVTSAGPYSISASVGGMSFTSSGNLTLASTSITLNPVLSPASTPTTAGVNNLVLATPAPSCSIPITVAPGTGGSAIFEPDCGTAVVAGSYNVNTALGATNTITLQFNVTTGGTYNISTPTVNGMKFSKSGTFATGLQTISLVGSGTPFESGDWDFDIPGTTSPCAVTVTVNRSATVDWTFKIGATTYSGSTDFTTYDNTTLPPFVFIDLGGSNASNHTLYMSLLDSDGNVTVGGTYTNGPTGPFGNAGEFIFDNGTTIYLADLSTQATAVITFNILTHNTTTKVITGGIAGNVQDDNTSAVLPLTAGAFTIRYH